MSIAPNRLRAAVFSLSILGSLGLLLGASGFFLRLQDALETVWGVRREEPGMRVQLRKRFLGLFHAAASGIILLAGLTAAAVVLSPGGREPADSHASAMARVAEGTVAYVMFWSLATFWFRRLPPVRLSWREIIPWTALIAALHLLGRLILTWYTTSLNPTGDVSAAGAFFLVLLWFYYAGNVFLYVAELMRVGLQHHGGAEAETSRPTAPG